MSDACKICDGTGIALWVEDKSTRALVAGPFASFSRAQDWIVAQIAQVYEQTGSRQLMRWYQVAGACPCKALPAARTTGYGARVRIGIPEPRMEQFAGMDLETLQFAGQQEARAEKEMTLIAAEDENIGRLMHMPGFGVITAVTVYAAIGDIRRFEDADHLVGYAGMGARVHESGMSSRSGKITKAGRRDLRVAMVEAAHVVANSHPHWKAELARLQPRIGYNRAIVAIARKLLITVWFVLQGKADKYAEPKAVAQKMLKFAYSVGKANRAGKTAAQFARERLDKLQMGEELASIPWGAKKPIPLPPSKLKQRSDVPNR